MIKKYGYARVSTREQNLDRQLTALREYIEDERDIITDKEIVKSLDRLGRNAEAIKAELLYYRQQEIRVQIIDLPTTMTDWPEEQRLIGDMINNILIEVYSMIAEQERMTIRQRQAEGIAAAKAAGRHLGRARAARPEGWEEVLALWRGGSITAVQAMDRLGMRKTTFYKLVREEQQGAV